MMFRCQHLAQPSRRQDSPRRITSWHFFFWFFLATIGTYVELEAQQHPNVLLICVDDLRPELNCFGVDYIYSPNIDRLAQKSIRFTQHYVQAPTCGASRFALLTGCYGGASNNALMSRGDAIREGQERSPSMPAWFRRSGYTTVSVGKVSHYPGGLGGSDWDDPQKTEMPNSWDRHLLPAGAWQHPRGWMHGLANGEIRENAKDMDVFQSLEGPDSIYPDGLSTEVALQQLDELAAQPDQPFFLAFGILRPHLPFGAPAKYMQHYVDAALPVLPNLEKPLHRSTWHRSGEFMKYNRWNRNPIDDAEFAIEVRKHYAACVSFADAQVGRILDRLRTHKLEENTIVVLWGDHGWHLGEHAIWGKHSLFEESLHSPLMIHSPSVQGGAASEFIVETVDLFPTLCDLAGVAKPDFIDGVSMKGLIGNSRQSGGEAISYFRSAQTIRTEQYRLISHKDGYCELYDHARDPGELQNIADKKPETVKRLLAALQRKRGTR